VKLVFVVAVAATACDNTQTACAGCLDDPPRICNSSCLTRIATSDAGGIECACFAGQCGNNIVSYALVCDDQFCQCSASGIIGNAGGSFPAPASVCESDVSVIEGLFNNQCSFPPK